MVWWTYPGSSVPPELKQKVLAVLDRYFEALESGAAQHICFNPAYQWRHYRTPTIDRMRAKLKDLDAYMLQQKGWVENAKSRLFDAGPDLSRLPDQALIALFQELDAAYAAQHDTGFMSVPAA